MPLDLRLHGDTVMVNNRNSFSDIALAAECRPYVAVPVDCGLQTYQFRTLMPKNASAFAVDLNNVVLS